MKFTVTTTTPMGHERIAECKNIREAGQLVAWCLHDNLGISKPEATQIGMQAERERTLTHESGYSFAIEKAIMKSAGWQMYEDNGSDPR
jgi:hypothetical protein